MQPRVFFGVDKRGLINIRTPRNRVAPFKTLPGGIEKLRNPMVLPRADEEIDLRHFVFKFFRIALRQTTRGHEQPAAPGLLHLGEFENDLDRFLFRGLDKRTGIDDDDFRILTLLGDDVAVALQQSEHDLRINEILRASETDEIKQGFWVITHDLGRPPASSVPEVSELHGNLELILLFPEKGDRGLEVIPVFSRNPDLLVLDLGLHFQLAVFERGNDFLAFFL